MHGTVGSYRCVLSIVMFSLGNTYLKCTVEELEFIPAVLLNDAILNSLTMSQINDIERRRNHVVATAF